MDGVPAAAQLPPVSGPRVAWLPGFWALPVLALISGSCVGSSARPIVQPTAAEPSWQVFQSTDAALGLTLPPSWKIVPLTPDYENVLRSSTSDPELQAQLQPVLQQLRGAGVKFFAFDPSTPVGNFRPRQFPALAYASRTITTVATLDAFFAGLPPEPTGRVVIDEKHLRGAVGDMVVRRVRETRVRADGSRVDRAISVRSPAWRISRRSDHAAAGARPEKL